MTDWSSLLGHVYYINLDRRVDRRQAFEQSMRNVSIPLDTLVTRFSAVDTSGRGWIGCSKSHSEVLKLAATTLATKVKHVVVFEDDFEWYPKTTPGDLYTRIQKTLHYLESDECGGWDVLLFCGVCVYHDPNSDVVNGIKRIRTSQTTSGYVVNRSYIPTLQKNFEESATLLEEHVQDLQAYRSAGGRRYAADQYWKQLQQRDRWYIFQPHLGRQRVNGGTDIIVSRTVRVHLCGRLGNNLFQYAVGLAYARETGRLFVNSNFTSQSSLLGHCKTNSSKEPFHVVQEESFAYHTLPPCPKANHVQLRGYFQSHKYFDKYKKEILSSIQFSTDQIHLTQVLYAGYCSLSGSNNNLVSIHVRRGDYTKPEKVSYHGLLTMSYFMGAIEALKTNNTNNNNNITHCLVFSDDMVWCRSNFVDTDSSKFYFQCSNISTEVDLLLMSMCQGGHIISNSSFSWWGAYMGQARATSLRKVVAPFPWFGKTGPPPKQCLDLYLPSWIKVDHLGEVVTEKNPLDHNVHLY